MQDSKPGLAATFKSITKLSYIAIVSNRRCLLELFFSDWQWETKIFMYLVRPISIKIQRTMRCLVAVYIYKEYSLSFSRAVNVLHLFAFAFYCFFFIIINLLFSLEYFNIFLFLFFIYSLLFFYYVLFKHGIIFNSFFLFVCI